jgi:Helix-loop-helix DNA-binding domain
MQFDDLSQWSFAPVSAAPAWPQPHTRISLRGLPETFPTMPSKESWNNFDGFDRAFENSTLGDQWDESEECENIQAGLPNPQYPINVPTESVPQHTAIIPNRIAPDQTVDFDSAFYSQQPLQLRPGASCGDIKTTPGITINELHSPTWNAIPNSQPEESRRQFQSVESSTPWGTRATSSEEEFSTNEAPIVSFEGSSGTRRWRSALGQQAQFHSVAAERGRMAIMKTASMTLLAEAVIITQKKSHKGTERKYREKLNDEFAALFQALPEEYVTAGIGGEFGSSVSKVETIQLAINHIEMLEQQQKELKQESLVLRGQVGLFESLIKLPER